MVEDLIQLAEDDPRVSAHEHAPPHVDGLFTLHSALGEDSNLTFFRFSFFETVRPAFHATFLILALRTGRSEDDSR